MIAYVKAATLELCNAIVISMTEAATAAKVSVTFIEPFFKI